MDNLVPLTEAKNRLHEIIRRAQDENMIVLRHGRPVAVIVAPDAYETLLEEIEDLKDRLSVAEARLEGSDLNIPIEKVRVELGLL